MVVIVLRNVQNAPIHYCLVPLRESRKKRKGNAMDSITVIQATTEVDWSNIHYYKIHDFDFKEL